MLKNDKQKIALMSLEKMFNEKGWFPIVGKINLELSNKFQNYIGGLEGDLKIVFDTSGGNVGAALKIIDLIKLWKKLSKKNIYSFCIGECSSAGLTILSACDKEHRESTANSVFHFHRHVFSPEFPYRGEINEHEIGEIVKDAFVGCEKALLQEVIGFGIPREKLLALRRRGDIYKLSYGAEKMLELKIIERIVEVPSSF